MHLEQSNQGESMLWLVAGRGKSHLPEILLCSKLKECHYYNSLFRMTRPWITFINLEIKYSSHWRNVMCGTTSVWQPCIFVTLSCQKVSVVSCYRCITQVSRSSRKSQVLISIDQLMTAIILFLSNLHFSCDVRKVCLGSFHFWTSSLVLSLASFLQQSISGAVYVKGKKKTNLYFLGNVY